MHDTDCSQVDLDRSNEVNFWFSKRFFVAVMMFLGTINTFALSANMNIAIVEMTSTKNTSSNNETVIQLPEFDWDSRTRGIILGAFHYGIAISMFGGYLAMKFGGSTIIGAGVAVTAIITIFNPVIIRFNLYIFLVTRAIEGIVEGFAIVSITELWTQWAPVQDRSRLMAIGFSGMYAGTAIAYPVCGYVIREFGWSAAFYMTGGGALMWSILWMLLVPNRPSSDKCLSKKELKYITENQTSMEQPKNLWLLCTSMLKSKCVLALGVTKFTYGVGFTIIVTCFPMYIKDMHKEAKIDEVGVLSSYPNIISAFTIPIIGYLVDYLHNKNILSNTQIHKLFMCGAFTIGAILMFIISTLSSSFIISMICFVLFKITLSTNYIISQLCCLSMAPKCSSIVFGFLSIFYTLSSVASPLLIGLIVTDNSEAQWNTCFLLSASLFLVGAITYLILGSSDPQPWSYSSVPANSNRNALENQ